MNWYKKAKLLDKAYNESNPIFLSCMYCNRWATETDEGGNTVWKKENQLSSSERERVNEAHADMVNGVSDNSGISHGICPYCVRSLKDVGGWPKTDEDTEYVIEKSLAMA